MTRYPPIERRGWRPRGQGVAAILVVFFLVIPVIRAARTEQGNALSFSQVALIKWTDPFVEIGFQIRTFVATAEWIEAGEDYANGNTYSIPVLRLVTLFLPVFERPQIVGTRYFIRDRLPHWGYSVVAEAYFNFGLFGVMIIPALIGLGLSLAADGARGQISLALAGGVMAILVMNIRNNFLFVPGQVFIVIVLWYIGKWIGRRSPYEAPPKL